MITASHPPQAPVSSPPEQLGAGYAQLQDVDQALREAERDLRAAHRDFAARQGPRPEAVYLEVLRLREQSRLLLRQLGDLFLRDEHRGRSAVNGMPSRQ